MAFSDQYILSSQVKVFPCAYRGQEYVSGQPKNAIFDPEARLNTEYNMTHISTSLKSSYIISWKDENSSADSLLCCVIGGYYFELKGQTIDKLANKYLCISLGTEEFNGEYSTKVLQSFEDSSKLYLDRYEQENNKNVYYFTALKISCTAEGSYQLQVSKTYNSQYIIKYDEYLPPILSGMGIDSSSNKVTSIRIGTTTEANANNSFSSGLKTKANADGSIAAGYQATADGEYSISVGNNTHTQGEYSIASGTNTKASGENSYAGGLSSVASGKNSYAIGDNVIASGENSHSEGTNNIASGINAHAEGSSNSTTDTSLDNPTLIGAAGKSSHTEGYNTAVTADAIAGHAEGARTEVSAKQAHAEGYGTRSAGAAGHAEGYKTINNGYAGHAEGLNTCTTSSNTNIEIWQSTKQYNVGDIVRYENKTYICIIANVTPTWNPTAWKEIGTGAHAEGKYTSAMGEASHAEGAGYKDQGTGVITYTKAIGTGAHAEGHCTTATGKASHTEGLHTQTTTTGEYSHAEGNNTTASGDYSHAEGSDTTAEGTGAHAEGNNTTASGDYSHAEGISSTASGEGAHAEGSDTTASGDYSHANGINTIAEGDYSFTAGDHTYADKNKLAVFGQYNLLKSNDNDLFIIGNGTASTTQNPDENRKNALVINMTEADILLPTTITGLISANNGVKSLGNITIGRMSTGTPPTFDSKLKLNTDGSIESLNGTDATGINTGSIKTSGGVGIARSLKVGDTITAANEITTTSGDLVAQAGKVKAACGTDKGFEFYNSGTTKASIIYDTINDCIKFIFK